MNSVQQEIPLRYTVSIGIITVLPTANTPMDVLYKLTDKALYRAKREGRNCVVRAQLLGES
ncbi:diguanylate cyclase [Paenibacillus sp. LC-T2]|uniref:Diguanylate cyclase n=2 Tax=Paenibacillus monticola TaxID=2666075 RepID=A0A7X2L3Q5_9BACL|nr:diguanylate cyclase [Paenibacillus monticola]